MFGKEAEVGKDTACDYLISQYGGVKMGFSDDVYEIANMIQDYLGTTKIKCRKLLQFIGNDYGRNTINEDIWINRLLRKINTDEYMDKNIFIRDQRYENEIDRLKEFGFVPIKIIKRNRLRQNLTLQESIHASETQEIDDSKYSYIIYNETTLEEFYEKLENIFNDIIKNIDE